MRFSSYLRKRKGKAMFWLLAAVVVVALITLVSVKLQVSRSPFYPYKRIPALFTPAERSFFGVLHQAAGKDFLVFGKVRVADIVAVKTGIGRSAWRAAFNQISQKHFDFVLCSPTRASALGCHKVLWHKSARIIVNNHCVMPASCKLARNRVYSRLLGGGNDGNERGKPDGLFERNRRSTQAQQRNLA
jgi:hypothetical protein